MTYRTGVGPSSLCLSDLIKRVRRVMLLKMDVSSTKKLPVVATETTLTRELLTTGIRGWGLRTMSSTVMTSSPPACCSRLRHADPEQSVVELACVTDTSFTVQGPSGHEMDFNRSASVTFLASVTVISVA
jgi:hypothetical protein